METKQSTNDAPDTPGAAETGSPEGLVDVSSCDREPIHLSGAIQPHGVFLSFCDRSLRVAQASENAGELLGVEVTRLLGQPLLGRLGLQAASQLRAAFDAPPVRLSSIEVPIRGVRFDGILHRSEGLLVLELEPQDRAQDGCYELLDVVFAIVDRLQEAQSIGDLCQSAADHIRALTGFDRTMVYRFHPDDHGEVIAESRHPDLEPYLHLHYPASDIPAQTRTLYLLNRTRQIVDIRRPPAAILPPDNPLTGRPVDLSLSTLRSVSPTHVEYMANMGMRASMSISLIKDGKLWGLIACHHRDARRICFRRRKACEFLGSVLAGQLVTREQRELAQARLDASRRGSRLLETMTSERDTVAALTGRYPTLVELLHVGGAAVCCDGRWTRLGRTPACDDLDRLGAWVRAQASDGVVATDCLSRELPEAERWSDVASGLLAIILPDAPYCLVLWFRPETLKDVKWGGDPSQPVVLDPGGCRLSPRRSFAVWTELVRRHSTPWQAWEIEIARELRQAILRIVLSRSAELERLNSELRDAVRMRDDFMSMASHELRTPIFTLALQIEGLSRVARGQPETFSAERARPRLELAKRQVWRLEQLVSGLLDFSRIGAGRLDLDLEDVDLSELLAEVLARFADDLAAAGCAVRMRSEPAIVGRWDPMRLDQVMTNLLSNALKYGAGAPIEIETARIGDAARIAIADHGIGIDEDAQTRIFDRFERAVSPGHYSGFGLGLWIARHIVEQLGGTIEVRSAPGQGSTFTVELPIAGPTPPAGPALPTEGGGRLA